MLRNKSVKFDVQIHWYCFKHHDLRHTNAEKGANLNHTLRLKKNVC